MSDISKIIGVDIATIAKINKIDIGDIGSVGGADIPSGSPAGSPVVWYDASTIGGLSDNDPLVTWEDLGSAGANLTAGAGAAAPTYKTGIQNSLPGIYYDGGDTTINEGGLPGFGASPNGHATLFIVVNLDTGFTTEGLYEFTRSAATVNDGWGLYSSGGTFIANLHAWDGSVKGVTHSANVKPVDTVGLYTVVYDYNISPTSSANRLWRNGTVSTSSGINHSIEMLTPAVVDSLSLGALGGGIYKMSGYIHEFIFYNTVLSSADITATESYLMTKWGL